MGLAPLTFTGVSSLSSDLQTVLTRAVNIASLPLKRLQNEDADVIQRKSLLTQMSAPLAALGSAVSNLGSIASKNAVSALSSNSAKVSVVNSGATAPALYSITEITSLAKAATETTSRAYATSDSTPVSSHGAMRLVVGGNHYDFTLTSNNLLSLRDQINGLGAGVNASILTTSSGNYLSLSAGTTGQKTLQLIDDPSGGAANILTANNQGANAQFKLNGIPISRPSNTVNDIIPGVTFTVLDTTGPGESVNLNLATDRSQLSTAISDFVTKYNAVVDQISQQVGANAGLLSGDFLVREVQNDLRTLGGYQASGTIASLSDLGVVFDSQGKVSFDTNKFAQLSDTQLSGAFQFFGSSTSGFGALAAKFTQLTDPVSGLIRLQQDSYDATDRRLQSQIADTNERISNLQKSVSAKLQAADALLAGLESQQKALTASIQSVNYALYGKQQSN